MDEGKITIDDQIKCAERELAMRKRVYPRWITAKKMSEEKANREIAVMESIIKTLKAVKKIENGQLLELL